MSYLQFHAVFVIPPILALLLVNRGFPAVAPGRRVALFGLGLMALVALVYTTPWDSYLVARGVWGYGEGRVVGTLWRVPLEEYLFFVLQTLLAGLWLYHLLRLRDRAGLLLVAKGHRAARYVGTTVWVLAGLVGVVLMRGEAGLYLGLVLAWASPVLALQWAYGGRLLWHARRVLALGVAVPTAYLWVADRLAIGADIWSISERYTLGINPFGLPVEEMVFFAITTLMVVQGLMLFLWVCGRLRRRSGGDSEEPRSTSDAL